MNHIIYILIAAVVTYLIRALPLTLLHKDIKNRFLRSFLYYVPYATLACMTFPAILYCTDSVLSASIGFALAVVLALFGKSLITVAVSSCAIVFVVELLEKFAF